jgi:hypothetical protein
LTNVKAATSLIQKASGRRLALGALLQPFPLIDTRKVDECRAGLRSLYGGIELTPLQPRGSFHTRVNYLALKDVGLSYGQFGTPVRIGLAEAGAYAQGFPIKGSGRHKTTDGEELTRMRGDRLTWRRRDVELQF